MALTAGDVPGIQRAAVALQDAIDQFNGIKAHVTSTRDATVAVHQSTGADAMRATMDTWINLLVRGITDYQNSQAIMTMEANSHATNIEQDRTNAQRLLAMLNKNA
jgi:hypothetical protein